MSDMPPQFEYKAFTTAHDEVIAATELCDEEELDRLRAYLDQQLVHLQGVVTKLANRLQRRLMAQQARSWDFDQEEGILDAARLARVIVNPMLSLSYKVERETEFKDTVVTILIDNSGSDARPTDQHRRDQRRHPGAHARTCRGEDRDSRVHDAGVEGRAGARGMARRGPFAAAGASERHSPHHLQAGRRAVAARQAFARADDARRAAEGEYRRREALLWAHQRLIARPEDRKVLMVISDGAPVDDSTLSVNSGSYLERHLRQVIGWIESRSPVDLVAIGIGHDVTRYYQRAVTIMDADQLGGTIIEQLAALFDTE